MVPPIMSLTPETFVTLTLSFFFTFWIYLFSIYLFGNKNLMTNGQVNLLIHVNLLICQNFYHQISKYRKGT